MKLISPNAWLELLYAAALIDFYGDFNVRISILIVMCSPSGLILILIASLFYNCLFSVIVAVDAKTNNSKEPRASATFADSKSRGDRFHVYYHHQNDSNSRATPDEKIKNISSGRGNSISTPSYDNNSNPPHERLIDLTRKHKIYLNSFEIT
uniref:Uncharacterized protein n=1 Tax=Glossina brevipalpis TaxID=37001 RepID=A0A1A9WYH1_9MUSC